MKTSELMKKLNNMSGIRAFNKSRISVLDSTSECLAEVGTSGSFLNIYKNCPYEVSKLIVEYYLTPLEEREEEKKYYLNTHNSFNNLNRHLVYSAIYNGFVLLGVNDESNSYIKSRFTQKEIDAMPFDTNFFIKEEVDEN